MKQKKEKQLIDDFYDELKDLTLKFYKKGLSDYHLVSMLSYFNKISFHNFIIKDLILEDVDRIFKNKNIDDIKEGMKLYSFSENYHGTVKMINNVLQSDVMGWGFEPISNLDLDDIKIK